MNNSIYDSIILSKTGSQIPLLKNGKTVESRYNPEREAQVIIQDVKNKTNSSLFLVFGIGSGILIKGLLEEFPDCKIIAVERYKEDIEFLSQIALISNLKKNSSIIFTYAQNLTECLCNNTLPAKYGMPHIIELRAWMQENIECKNELEEAVNKAFRIISADYSVQAHFGKIWMHNILGNLTLLSEMHDNISTQALYKKIDRNKTALILAAGPSLDKKIEKIKNNRQSYYIISTDTASQSLRKSKCNADAVISIDGQNVSVNHFSGNVSKDTLYFFDLCASSSAAKYISSHNASLIYFSSGHPMCSLAGNFPQIFSGAGTVTIAAADLAFKLGFKKVIVLGADFAYSEGKAYTGGTYLESLNSLNENKLISSEKKYDTLMFRTELQHCENNKKTTEILSAYKSSFIDYLKLNEITFEYKDDEYHLLQNKEIKDQFFINENFKIHDFLNYCANCKAEEIETALLPYIAYLRKQDENKNTQYSEFLKLAQTYIVRYNEIYEK